MGSAASDSGARPILRESGVPGAEHTAYGRMHDRPLGPRLWNVVMTAAAHSGNGVSISFSQRRKAE